MEVVRNLINGERRRWVALAVVCLGQLMMVLDGTIVNVALPAMQRDLGFSPANLAWVLDAYLIAFGSFLLLAGRLGDLLGRKRMFLSGVAMFTLASVACGLAGDQLVLVVARFVQGLGGAMASAAVLALLVTDFPRPSERAIALSVYTFILAGGGSLGLLAGGVLTQAVDWHWIFFINVPIGIVTFALGSVLIGETDRLGLGRGVDVTGAVLVTAAMMLGVYAIVKVTDYGWLSAHTLACGAAAVALLATFVAVESRLPEPMFPLRILRIRGLAGSNVVRGFAATGMYSTFLLGVLYLQHVHRYGALQTGLAFLPLTLLIGLFSLGVTARLISRFGTTPIVLAGLTAIAAALLLLARLPTHTSYFPTIALPFTLLGLGAGLSFLPLTTIAMADVPIADAGLASGILNATQQISVAIGTAALATIAADRTNTLASQGQHHLQALTSGFHLGWTAAAGAVTIGALIALLLLRPPKPSTTTLTSPDHKPIQPNPDAA
jgi:EmrB/QacA subfamily drug resistance transporter